MNTIKTSKALVKECEVKLQRDLNIKELQFLHWVVTKQKENTFKKPFKYSI